MKDRQLTALATKAAQGDESAFEELYAEHVRSILFHVRSLIIDKENCYDVAQDAVLQMFTHIHQLRNPAAFRGWMHQVIRTTCAAHNRSLLSAGKFVDSEEVDEELEAIEDDDAQIDPEAATMAKLEGNQIFAIISELPEHYREILAQRFYDDLSYKEISEILGISMSNVGMRLQRATDALRKKMGERGLTYDALDKGASMKDQKLQTQAPDAGKQEDGASTSAAASEHAAAVPGDISAVAPSDTPAVAPSASEESSSAPDGGIQDDNIKASFNSGIAMLFPSEPVGEFLASTNAKLVDLAGAASAAGEAGQTTAAATSTGLRALIISLVAVVVVAAMVVVTVTLNAPSDTEVNNAEDTSPPAQQGESIAYSGTMHLNFVDENGNDSDRNVVSATLTEDKPAAIEVSWSLYEDSDSSGEGSAISTTPLVSGQGNNVGSETFASLEPGYYLLVFTLIDENNASAEVKRNFTIAE